MAAETLADVKRSMKINYFEDKELIAEQAKRFMEGEHYSKLTIKNK